MISSPMGGDMKAPVLKLAILGGCISLIAAWCGDHAAQNGLVAGGANCQDTAATPSWNRGSHGDGGEARGNDGLNVRCEVLSSSVQASRVGSEEEGISRSGERPFERDGRRRTQQSVPESLRITRVLDASSAPARSV